MDFTKIYQLKGLKPINKSPHEQLWMLWFDEKSISKSKLLIKWYFPFLSKKKEKEICVKTFFLFSSRPTFPSSSQANLYRFNFCQIRTKSPFGLAFTMVLYLSPRQVWPTQGNFASRKKLEQHSYHESEVWYYLQVSFVYTRNSN